MSKNHRISSAVVERLEDRQLLSGVPVDPGFGSGGYVNGLTGPTRFLPGGKIAVDYNGKIIRLNANGSVDTSFNSKGWVDDWKPGVARQADGKLVVLQGNVVSRYNTNGSLDTAFGIGGHFSAFTTNANYSAFHPSDLTMEGSKIVVAGDATPQGYDSRPTVHAFAVERIDANGTLDATFGLQAVEGNGIDSAVSNRVRIGPDARIYIAGSLPNNPDAFLVRFNSDGSGGVRVQLSGASGDAFANDLGFTPDGKIVVVGMYDSFMGSNHYAAYIDRLNPDLSLDGTYAGPNGIDIDYGADILGNIYASIAEYVSVGPDGSVLVSLTGSAGPQLLKLLPNGERPAGDSVSGYVYHDANGNGRFDVTSPYERGLAGWQVYADVKNVGYYQPGDPSAITDFTGFYAINGLKPGSYRIRETRLNNYVRTSPPGDWPNFGLYNITFTGANQAAMEKNFGNAVAGTIFVQVLNNTTGNGFPDPAAKGLAGWRVYLDNNHNGNLDPGEPSALTDANGRMQFTGLPPGAYEVKVVGQSGWRQTVPVGGAAQYVAEPSDEFPTNTVVFAESRVATPYSSIGGAVIMDNNADGRFDLGDSQSLFTPVYLDRYVNGKLVAQTTTQTDYMGAYSFQNLSAGTYVVRIDVPAYNRITWPSSGKNYYTITLPASHLAFGDVNFLITDLRPVNT